MNTIQDWSRFLFYYRVSSQEQEDDGHALERYREQGIALGIPEENLYTDTASGAVYRDGLNEMLERLGRDRTIEGLAVPFHSRLHRNRHIWNKIESVLVENDLKFVDLSKGKKPVDFTSAEGSFSVNLDALLAERESKNISERTRRGHQNRRAKARGMIPPFGYIRDRNTGKFLPRTEEYRPGITWWDAAQRIVHLFAFENKNFSAICRIILDEWGPSQHHRGHPSTNQGVSNYLKNPVLRGNIVYFRNGRGGNMQLIPDQHEALIDNETWERIKTRFKFKTNSPSRTYQLTGICRCSYCGSKLNSKSSKRTLQNGEIAIYKYLFCQGARPRAGHYKTCEHKKFYAYKKIEAEVIQQLTKKAKAAVDMALKKPATGNQNNAEIAKLTEEIRQILALGLSGMESAIKDRERAIAALQVGNSDRPSVSAAVIKELVSYAADADFWALASPSERASLYQSLISQLVISETAVSVQFLETL